jgi:hypothetical protein
VPLPAAIADDDPPTPDPRSAVVQSSRDGHRSDALAAAIEEARRLYGSDTSEAWFTALVDGTHPLCRLATPGRAEAPRPRLTEADLVTDPALLEAAERYAGEVTRDRELADLQAGRHPLRRRPSP